MNHKNIYIALTLDIAAAIIVWLLFYAYHFAINDMALGANDWSWQAPSYNLILSLFAFPVTATCIHYLSGIYNKRKPLSRVDECITTLVASFFISMVIYFVMLTDDKAVSYKAYIYSFFILWFLFFTVTYAIRLYYTLIIFAREKQGISFYNVVIVGAGNLAGHAKSYLDNSKAIHCRHLAGYITDKTPDPSIPADMILGTPDKIDTIIKEFNVSIVIIAIDNASDTEMFAIINRLIPNKVEIDIVPDKMGLITGNTTIRNLTSGPFINITNLATPAWQQSVKRAFDITASSILTIILSPLLLFLSIRIKSDSKGPVFYKQERIGLDGKPFYIYKFRTMYTDAEKAGPCLSRQNDPRITPFGRTMRRYRLDELPQLWNIIRGDMSVVGPRPERRFYINQIEEVAPYYPLVYKVRPGLLSWGPIRVGYTDTLEKMVRRLDYDIVYIENMSLTLDLKIMLFSIGTILNGEGQ